MILFICGSFLSCSRKITGQSIDKGIYSKAAVVDIMKKVYDWQVAHPVNINLRNDADWARAAFYSGVMRAYKSTGEEDYLNGAITYASSVQWKPAARFRHADDVARGQTFLEIYAVKKEPYMITGIQARIDSLMADRKKGREDWWWCDALFMAPPVIARLYEQTGDKKYSDYLNDMWWDAASFLFDKEENLFYRDKNFFGVRTAVLGKKLFWSRGNGWVMGGLVQVMEHLDRNDPNYLLYVDLFKKMAAKIATLQQADGLWRASLLDPEEVPVKETSGSAFYSFALAWGLNNHLLDRAVYLPVVLRGWKALTNEIQPDGKLTWVQQIGAKPAAVQQSDNQEYGTGAFLMAGTEMMKLKK